MTSCARCSPGPWRKRPGGLDRPHRKEPVRLIVHKTAVVDGRGQPGEVIEAAGDRLVVAAGTGAVALLVIQLPGKKPFTAAEFLRGHRIQPGDQLGR